MKVNLEQEKIDYDGGRLRSKGNKFKDQKVVDKLVARCVLKFPRVSLHREAEKCRYLTKELRPYERFAACFVKSDTSQCVSLDGNGHS